MVPKECSGVAIASLYPVCLSPWSKSNVIPQAAFIASQTEGQVLLPVLSLLTSLPALSPCSLGAHPLNTYTAAPHRENERAGGEGGLMYDRDFRETNEARRV